MLNVFVHAAHSNSACGITRVYRGAADHSTRLPALLQPQQAQATAPCTPRNPLRPPSALRGGWAGGRQTKRRRVISACAASLLSAYMHQRADSMECCSGFSEFRVHGARFQPSRQIAPARSRTQLLIIFPLEPQQEVPPCAMEIFNGGRWLSRIM
jgi:hypothetical protein